MQRHLEQNRSPMNWMSVDVEAIMKVFEEGFGEGLFAKSPSPTTLSKALRICDHF